MAKQTLTQARLKELLHYDPETGNFTNRITRGARSKAGNRTGSFDAAGYWIIRLEGTSHKAHRLAFLYLEGQLPSELVDHRNRIKHDNRWRNLRRANAELNRYNTDLRVDNVSGCSGVKQHTAKNGRVSWMVNLSVNGERKYLGVYATVAEAIAVREKAKKQYFEVSAWK